MGLLAYRRGVVDIGRCHCAGVCFGAASVRIREGHWRDCKSSLRGIDAIGCGWTSDAVVDFSRCRNAWRWGAKRGRALDQLELRWPRPSPPSLHRDHLDANLISTFGSDLEGVDG